MMRWDKPGPRSGRRLRDLVRRVALWSALGLVLGLIMGSSVVS
ncbi:MAG: hypothetical protein AB7S92_07780 [Parvibaculaceae bacterium]